jgi:hypothetical protein
MSKLIEYLNDFQKTINSIPYSLSADLNFENRGDLVLIIKGKVKFINSFELHFKEYLLSLPTIKKISYSYHFQNQDGEIIFRYDNARNHPEINTYPNHKHTKEKILPAVEPSLSDILAEIIRYIKKTI